MTVTSITVLRFVHGKYAGQEFPLDTKSIVVGRSVDVDLRLADDAVSRKHARFYGQRDRRWVHDLGSSNGTIVNGKPVATCCLRIGDRIAVGSSLIRVETRAAGDIGPVRAGEKPSSGGVAAMGHSMTGSIEDIPLMDVLQWLATSKKSGTLTVRDSEGDRLGALYFRTGGVYYAAIDTIAGLHPDKALLRIIGWEKGVFDFANDDMLENPPVETTMSLEHLLMEAARQHDEFSALRAKHQLPAEGTEVRVVLPTPVRWSTLDAPLLELVQSLMEHGSWWIALNRSARDDAAMYRALVELRTRGVVMW